GDGAMIGVVVDGPVIEDGIGVFIFDHFQECRVVRVIDDGVAVRLACPNRPGLEDVAGLSSLGNADGRGGLPRSIVQVEQRYVVALGGEQGDGAAASVFGVAGMAAGDNEFELAGSGFAGGIATGGDECGCSGKPASALQH